MCGIVGIIDLESKVESETLIRMRDTLSHRGPDGAGIYLSADSKVGLGHRRLSIIDLSSAGRQPMCNENRRIWVTYNGEIYNFQTLREELIKKGHTFKSQTDTEIIIHSYEQWGEECVSRFIGMFSFAIYDENKEKLFLARDRFGIKPLFYYWDGERFLFGSEIKAIIAHPMVKRDIDSSAIYDYLTYLYIPTPKTIYKNIRKLPPAHTLTFDTNDLDIKEYWDVDFKSNEDLNENECINLVNRYLNESVKMQLISDVPVGVFLSGGLDSSIVTAKMCNIIKAPVKTFSIGFDVKEHSEIEYSRIMADKFQTQHHEKVIGKDILEEMIPKVISMYDEPCSNSSAIPTYYVSKLAKKRVKVVLSGDGADEVFAGYNWYDRWLKLQKYNFIPHYLKSNCFNVINTFSNRIKVFPNPRFMSHMFLPHDGVEQYGHLMSVFTPEEKRENLSEGFLQNFSKCDDFWYFRKYWRSDLDPISRMQYLDMKTYLHEDCLAKVDRASMAVGLEVRVPFLDHRLVETIANFPPLLRYNNGDKKYILKQSMKNDLPKEIVERNKKGFSAPIHYWLDKNIVAKSLLNGECMKRGIFDEKVMHNMGKLNGAHRFSLMVLEKWFRMYG